MASWTPEHLAPSTLPNAKSPWATAEQERADRQAAAEAQLQAIRSQWPALMAKLARIPDPRRPGSIRHKLTVVLVYGMLLFVLQYASRREGNRELGRPCLGEALRAVFPDLQDAEVPHLDTVNRLLARIPPEALQQVLTDRIQHLLRQGKLAGFMVRGQYVIALDGMHKLARTFPWTPQALRWRNGGSPEVGYTVYLLEAVLVSPQGVTLPVLVEFCANEPVADEPREQAEARKQDCEQKAFQRVAARLKRMFPRLRLLIVADGLYANGPVVALCRRNQWDFMITLKDGSLPAVWTEAEALCRLEPDNTLTTTWGDRQQIFRWANHIEYVYGPSNRGHQQLHVVICEEHWHEHNQQGEQIERHARYAWLSGRPLSAGNLAERCNRAGRHRWDIEEHILAIKRHGYQAAHAFSWNWNAMRNWHCLMLIACLLNTLACYSVALWDLVCARGFAGTIRFLRESYLNPWLDLARLRLLRTRPAQLRLIF
jgi:hypothetical protein